MLPTISLIDRMCLRTSSHLNWSCFIDRGPVPGERYQRGDVSTGRNQKGRILEENIEEGGLCVYRRSRLVGTCGGASAGTSRTKE